MTHEPQDPPAPQPAGLLPRGKHQLPRGFVVNNQRERIMAALADVVSIKGYHKLTVEDIISTAGVSRRTFYDIFKNKNDAFLASFDTATDRLIEHVREPREEVSTTDEFRSDVRTVLRMLLEFVANDPNFVKLCAVEVLAAGPQAVKRRNAMVKRLADLLYAGSVTIGSETPAPRLVSDALAGGLYAVIYDHSSSDSIEDLPSLLPDLVYFISAPYFGIEIAEEDRALAQAEMEQAK